MTARGGRAAGFTLLEVLVAMSILMVAMSLALGAFLAALKRTVHAQNVMIGTQELRFAADMLSEAARSAPQDPVVQNSGLSLLVAPKNLGYAVVVDGTWIDQLNNVKGWKSNQRVIKLADYTPSIVAINAFRSGARPAGVVSTSEVATYFVDSSSLPTMNISDLFSVGDTVTIPATAYGPQFSKVINSVSNGQNQKTITMTEDLGVDVPQGTRILATSGRRLKFIVESTGELRYYPDHRDTSVFSVLARDIDPSPLTDPANAASAVTVPFALSGRYLTINLQRLPRGTMAGRTVQGVQTTIFVRTDPLIP